jgi:hypothetical protein
VSATLGCGIAQPLSFNASKRVRAVAFEVDSCAKATIPRLGNTQANKTAPTNRKSDVKLAFLKRLFVAERRVFPEKRATLRDVRSPPFLHRCVV